MQHFRIKKYTLLFLGFFLILFPVLAQNSPALPTIKKLSELKPIRVKEHPMGEDPLVVYLPMYFSSSHFLPKTKFDLPKGKEIISVHLVYTRYRQVDTFNQRLLNENRFLHLNEKLPQLFTKQNIEWRIFEQTKGKTEDQARKMFHGFIVFLKDEIPPEIQKTEIGVIDDLIAEIHDSLVNIPDRDIYRIRKKYVETGRFLPRREDKISKGLRYENAGIWFREPETKIILDSVKRKTIKGYTSFKGFYSGMNPHLKKLDIYNQIRNKSFKGKWAFVIDVTGSMAPYTGQVMAILKSRPNLATDHYFSFFNDGNGAPEILKRIGNSGGVYTVKTSNFDSIYQTMQRAMNSGSGGDLPENNIEAILRSLKKWSDVDTVLMVADANAPVKDIRILRFVDKPVQLVLCGDITNLIPLDYVRIAKATKGNILTNDGEIRDLHLKKVGQTIEVGEAEYTFTQKGLERR